MQILFILSLYLSTANHYFQWLTYDKKTYYIAKENYTKEFTNYFQVVRDNESTNYYNCVLITCCQGTNLRWHAQGTNGTRLCTGALSLLQFSFCVTRVGAKIRWQLDFYPCNYAPRSVIIASDVLFGPSKPSPEYLVSFLYGMLIF